MKKGFTLVELLVVVAILGILAAVGIVSFGGFLGSSKANASKTIHLNVVSFISASILRCSMQDKMTLLDQDKGPLEYTCNSYDTSINKYPIRDAFIHHFRGSGIVNPYDGTQNINNYLAPFELGVTSINNVYEKGGELTGLVINTYYKDGVDCLEDTVKLA